MNLSPEWIPRLAAAGHDAVHWREVGPGNAPDEQIVEWATEQGRAIFTGDLGFGRTVAQHGLTAPSVIQLRSVNTDPDVVGEFVVRSIAAAEGELNGGAILTIGSNHARIRLGPDHFIDTDE